MLRESLKVVEAARQLKLVLRGDRTVSDLSDPVQLAFAIDALRSSLEAFDASEGTRRSRGAPRPLARPDFATPPQMDDDGYVEDHLRANGEVPSDVSNDLDREMEEEEALLDELEAEERQETMDEIIKAMSSAAPVMFPLRSGLRPSDLPEEVIDGVFIADDTIEQLEMGLDMIEDRLGYAVRKSGWSYKLKGLAEAARNAIGSLDLLMDKEREETWVAMPSESFSELIRHVTDVAVNHDTKIELPAPKVSASASHGMSTAPEDDIADEDLNPFDAAM